MDNSRTETTDSDKESDYVTGLEDIPETPPKTTAKRKRKLKAKDILRYLSDPSQTSAFIQSILYEDSCSGVAVVDLFVAVKVVKDKLDILVTCNNEVLDKITRLNRETIAIRTSYRNLMRNMRLLLGKITGNEKKSQSDVSREELPESEFSRSGSETSNSKEGGEGCCSCCGRQESNGGGLVGGEGSRDGEACPHEKVDCLGCLLSALDKRAEKQTPIVTEAVLGSFIASMFWLQRGGACARRMSPQIVAPEETKNSEGSIRLSESKMRLICNFCESLCGNAKDSRSSSKEETPTERPRSRALSTVVRSEEEPDVRLRGKDSPNNREDTESDGESIFEEALTELAVPSISTGKHNVTCMGDLSDLASKKNVSTFTANSDSASSRVEKLTEDIKTQITKVNSKAKVAVVGKPHKNLKKLARALEQAIAANTPEGTFGVTVLQYQKPRGSKNQKFVRVMESFNKEPEDQQLAEGKSEESFFLDDLDDSESEPEEETSDSGETEDFRELRLEDKKEPKELTPTKGELKLQEWKRRKSLFFEIEKCYPVMFVQEIIQKRERREPEEEKEEEVVERGGVGSGSALRTGSVPGERQQQEIVIRRSSSDLVIYIQVEVEEGGRSSGEGVVLEYSGKEEEGRGEGEERLEEEEEKVIKLEEEEVDGESLYHVWRGYETGILGEEGEERERITFDESVMIIGEQEAELRKEDFEDEEKVVMVKELKEKSVTFSDVLSEIFTETEIQETHLEEEEEEKEEKDEENVASGRETRNATVVEMMEPKLDAEVWFQQNEASAIQRTEILNEQEREKEAMITTMTVVSNDVELEKALDLIREIESDVVEVKLSDAISILPRLESELRKHLQEKMMNIGETDLEKGSSVDNFFSAVDFWPDEEVHYEMESSKERLGNVLTLLTSLEEAVKASESSNHVVCEFSSSKIFRLLNDLIRSIRELEVSPNMMSLSQTLDIASRLDTAVREYDSVLKKQTLECLRGEENEAAKSNSLEETLVNQHLKNVRKKVFEIVEEEAVDMEGRIERDFDRLDRLERENDEAMAFLEAFLQKTERRAAELQNLKANLKELTSSMTDIYNKIMAAVEQRQKKSKESKKEVSVVELMRNPSKNMRQEEVPIRETISGLLLALDSLKSRAREKNELCREILFPSGYEKFSDSERSSRRSSRSSFTAKQAETLTSTVKEFKKIGDSSLYMSWTQPEGSPSVSVLGYEIHVNGTLNQKVRKPQRLQAVLYAVDLTKDVNVNLYAVVDSGSKVLLASVEHLNT